MRLSFFRLCNYWLCCLVLSLMLSCQKDFNKQSERLTVPPDNADFQTHGHLVQTKTYSSMVPQKWNDLHLRILRISGPSPFGLNANRYFAYCGIALYESVVPGMPAYQSLSGQLNGMPPMPGTLPGLAYHWPTAANAALAFLSKSLFTLATAEYKASMDSLDNALRSEFQLEVDGNTFARSEDFGKKVAQLIFEWSKSDGAMNPYPPYVPSADPTKWSPTPPNPTTVSAPYWGMNRLFVPGSTDNTASPLPPAYSTDPGSAYFAMVKEVYDISQSLTPAQKATALYFRDNPGFQAGAHYQYIFSQIMHHEKPALDFYAVAQAKIGIAMAESQINCWKIKYDQLVDRPTKYIRNVLGHTGWTSFLSMPNHPDYPSGHSQTGGAFAAVANHLFGNDYAITLHTYDNLGMSPRSYSSFDEMVDDIGMSRVYGGIHYRYSCVEGTRMGKKIGARILNKLQFMKE